jgi:Mg-chelatase subunit ChlD
VTERAVRAANTAARRTLYRAVAPATGGTSLDYPYVILSDDPTVTATARRLRDALEDPAGRARLAGSGFRTGRSASEVRPLTAAGAREALRTLAVVDRPTQTLALVDVSGSMASPVPGAPGVTRMDLARTAIRRGLGLLPDGTVAGLWRFSADLTPSTDYEQLAPLTTFTRQSRKQFAGALSRLQVDPDGGTGLYSSTLAAVRYARSGYDPTRVNSVIVLSDGKDQDATAHGIGLHRLLTTLRAENDPKRPVIVISIAYGPDGDTAAMRRISAATGGTLYTVSDPRQLPLIFSEAIGHRLSSEQK